MTEKKGAGGKAKFDVLAIEKKWQTEWEKLGIYHFNRRDSEKPVFSIDTPPPYPSGDFHMGNVLNWSYFDILARYKRMRGFNVFFPQGWDCHGLGIEVQAEKENKIKKRQIPPDQFRKFCEKLVEKYITIMKAGIVGMGCSVDWTTEYRTMNPDYWRRTQLSFIILHKKGYMYQGTYPINWCPRCETAIADAEVNYEEHEGTLHYIKFQLHGSNEHLLIATTRPELIPACVAVAINPSDDRFSKNISGKIVVPIVKRVVPIIPDETVDPKFGTGVVMICTYGDKADVKTVLHHKLPRIIVLNQEGKINEKGGKYAGLSVGEARRAIVADLEQEGFLVKTESVKQERGTCDRCESPVEILELRQWFMKTRVLTDKLEEEAQKIAWYPEYMKTRLIDWARSLDWDWVISRQRVFATPIPAWYCKKCGETILADESWVPIDPKLEKPRINRCPKCGSTEFTPEADVFDTWMDSSLSCAVHAGWPDNKDWRRLFPADVHPSGIDIIRTWAYYLMVRHLALFGERPYKSCLINGMVLGLDGRKMSKSLKNYVAAPEVLNRYGADASRQWAAGGGATGSDIPYRQPDVEYGWRFLIKLWNASNFVNLLLKDFKARSKNEYQLETLDRWIMTKAEKLTKKVTEALDACQFNAFIEETRNFVWHVFCDNYIEAVKDRLYKPETHGESSKKAAQFTLYTVLFRTLLLMAPVIPHVTEEIYQRMYAYSKNLKSLHCSSWPTAEESLIDVEAEKNGDLLIAIIEAIRREKSERHKPLNAEIRRLTIFAGDRHLVEAISDGKQDIIGTCKVNYLEIRLTKGEGTEVKEFSNVHFATEY